MLSNRAVKIWAAWHKWTSLICTAFMLLLCLTGLPLIFHDEIDHWSGHAVSAPDLPDLPETASVRASLDDVLINARNRYPGRVVQFASQKEGDDRIWYVTLTPTSAPTEDFKSIAVDARTGQVLADVPVEGGIMNILLRLHVDMFAGTPGKLFLGAMGLLLLIAIVSGVVLYAPFMRKLDFGTVRHERTRRTRWLDLHNLCGIVTLAWAMVVGGTGAINTAADLLMQYWQRTGIQPLLAAYKNQQPVPVAERSSYQKALSAAQDVAPAMQISFIAFPETLFATPHHTIFYFRGDTPLTAKLLKPVMVDVRTAEVTASPALPPYIKALLLSQPLHFGDYGGLPMKILWALLDIATILVLGSGLYLWLKKRQVKK